MDILSVATVYSGCNATQWLGTLSPARGIHIGDNMGISTREMSSV